MHERHCAAPFRVHLLDQIEWTQGPLRLIRDRAIPRQFRPMTLLLQKRALKSIR